MMKSSMRKLGPVFNTSRMVQEYFEKFYINSYEKSMLLKENHWEKGKSFSMWKQNLKDKWNKVKFVKYTHGSSSQVLLVGEKFVIEAEIDLGGLNYSDVEVQIYFGKADDKNRPFKNNFTVMKADPVPVSDSIYKFTGEITCKDSGNFGYTFRILPKHSLLTNPFELGLIKWA